MTMRSLTGALDYGGTWRLTRDLLDLSDSEGKPTHVFALRDIRSVSRESFRVGLELGEGEVTEIECGSLEDAVALEDGLKQRMSVATVASAREQPYIAPQRTPSDKVTNLALAAAITVFVVLGLLMWGGSQMPPSPGTTNAGNAPSGSNASQLSIPTRVDLSGSGQKATQLFLLRSGLARFEFRNTGRSNFIVYLMDNNGQKLGLIANEIGTSSGSKAMNIPQASYYLLDVSSDGPWTVTITQ